MAISWNRYMSISRLTTKDYLKNRKIESYENLIQVINQRDVKLPLKEDIQEDWYFKPVKNSIKKKSVTKSQKEDISKRKPSRRTSTKRSSSKASTKVTKKE